MCVGDGIELGGVQVSVEGRPAPLVNNVGCVESKDAGSNETEQTRSDPRGARGRPRARGVTRRRRCARPASRPGAHRSRTPRRLARSGRNQTGSSPPSDHRRRSTARGRAGAAGRAPRPLGGPVRDDRAARPGQSPRHAGKPRGAAASARASTGATSPRMRAATEMSLSSISIPAGRVKARRMVPAGSCSRSSSMTVSFSQRSTTGLVSAPKPGPISTRKSCGESASASTTFQPRVSAPIRSSGPDGTSRMPVASTTITPPS